MTADAAARLADQCGWACFLAWWPLPNGRCACGRPDCDRVGKHPCGPASPHGPLSATRDVTQLRRLFRAWPLANLAVATGAASGVWVLDLDGPEGRANLLRLCDVHGLLPRTVAARSGSGSWHLWWRWPANRCPRSKAVAGWAGVDVRGHGSNCLAAPSLHRSGRRYQWVDGHAPWERALADAPAWLLDLVDPPRVERVVEAVPTVIHADRGYRYGQAALRRACEDLGRAVDYRNVTLNRVAFGLGGLVAAGYLDYQDVAYQLEAVALSIGLDERETLGTIRSGLAAGQRHPHYLAAG